MPNIYQPLWSNIRDLSLDSSDRYENKNDDCPSGSAHHKALGQCAHYQSIIQFYNHRSSPSWCSLSSLQITENILFSFERARVEHISCLYGNGSSVVKFVTTCAHFLGKYAERHLMFSGRRYREDLSLLGVFVGTTINANALCIRMGYGRRSGNGPRAHGILYRTLIPRQ